MDKSSKSPRKTLHPFALDARAQGTLRRFAADWLLPRWRKVLVALLFTAGLAASTGGYPLIIKHSFDSLMKAESGVLPWVIAAIIGVTSMRSLFLYLQQVTAARIVMRMTTDIQKAAFAHLINSDYARLMRETTGHLVSRLTNDLAVIQQASQVSIITFARDVLSVISVFGVMLYLDWMMTLIVIGIFPLAVLPVASIGKRLRSVARRTQAELGDMTSRLTEKLAGARLIKAFRLEDYATERRQPQFRADLPAAHEGGARAGPHRPGSGGIGGRHHRRRRRLRLLAHRRRHQHGRRLHGLRHGAAAGGPAHQVAGQRDEQHAAKGSPPPSASTSCSTRSRRSWTGRRRVRSRSRSGTIVFDNVVFGYSSAAGGLAVRNFSLTVPGGKTAALVGRSGAGKSTIINLVPRLFDVDSGRILIDGQDVRDVTLDTLRKSIAIVSQELTLFDDTIRNNIALGRLGASDAEIVAAAEAAAAHEFIIAQPQGYDTMVGDSGLRLSGGQRQRLALARAILKDAPILLLDEATSALDTELERLVQQALAQFTKNRTTLVIAHRLSTVQRADLICVMDAGRLVEVGTHGDLIAADGAYARLCRSQVLADLDIAPKQTAEPTGAL